MDRKKMIGILKNGGIGVMATDTIYGLLGSALLPATVERIYEVKGRDNNKPFIVLISSIDDLKKFDIQLSVADRKTLSSLWPGKVSIILPSSSEKFSYLHRGAYSLAFRLPKKKSLQELIKKTGPLVAPSANSQGDSPAATIEEAKEYFNSKIDFYADEGKIKGKSSTIISLINGRIKLVRGNKFDPSVIL